MGSCIRGVLAWQVISVLMFDIPIISVAKRRLCGKFAPLAEEQGALINKGGQLA